MVDKLKNILYNKNGQALFEMILFLPFLLFFYSVFFTIGNSLSGSINQQKAVRGYFYNLVKHNSYLISTPDLKFYESEGMKQVGFYTIGWRDYSDGVTPVANCFEFSSLSKNKSKEVCLDKTRNPAEMSHFVRIFTAYGICGPIFSAATSLSNDKKFIVDQETQTYGTKIGGAATQSIALCAIQ